MRHSLRSLLALFAIVGLGLVACKSTTTPQGGLATARARWAARGPDSYAVTVNRSCECLPEASGSVPFSSSLDSSTDTSAWREPGLSLVLCSGSVAGTYALRALKCSSSHRPTPATGL